MSNYTVLLLAYSSGSHLESVLKETLMSYEYNEPNATYAVTITDLNTDDIQKDLQNILTKGLEERGYMSNV